MSRGNLFGSSRQDGDGHWITVSDLMAGLMIIFLFIAITYIRPIVVTQNKIREIVVAWNESEVQLQQALEAEFQNDLPRWGAELDKASLTIRFKAPDVLFDSAKASLKPEFRTILSEFFPRYVRVLDKFRGAIDEVRIEGHTSSEWVGTQDQNYAYFQNMALSQERTRSILQYCLQLPALNEYRDWARSKITANGLSSSQLILGPSGSEDKVRSRRVEFRVRTNTKEQIVKVLETVE